MKNKYNWKICPRCKLAYIPFRKNQVFCSYWCELLDKENKREMNDFNEEKYIKEELEKINFDWKIKKVNNIETNPIQCYWTIGTVNGLSRFYKITPFNKCNENGLVDNDNPKIYYVLYEACNYTTTTDSLIKKFDIDYYDGIIPINASMVAVYEDLDMAKNRAKFQLFIINNIIENYAVKEKEV